MKQLILTSALLLLLVSLQAQQRNSYMNQRSRIDELRNKLLQVQEKEKQRERTLQAFQVQMKEIIQTRDSEQKIKSVIQLKRKISEQRLQLDTDTKEQIALATQLNSILNAEDNIPQVISFLENAKSTLRTIGIQQEVFRNKLSLLDDKLRNSVKNIPAPDTFILANGIKMKKIGKGNDAFYISETPIALQGKITYARAQEILTQLSVAENATYRLPTTKQVRLLQKNGFNVKAAIWCDDIWEAMPAEQYAIERFNIKLRTVWDPENILRRGTLFGELEQASYPELTVYVTTRLATGRKIQKAIVDKLMSEEP